MSGGTRLPSTRQGLVKGAGRRDPGAPRGHRPRRGLREPEPVRPDLGERGISRPRLRRHRPANRLRHATSGTTPGASPGVTVLPTDPPTSPTTGWTKLDVPARPAIARLAATRTGETSVALSTSFRLRSLTDTPVRALADRLVVSPALKLRVAKVEGRERRAPAGRPTAPVADLPLRAPARRWNRRGRLGGAGSMAAERGPYPARRLQLQRAPRHRHRDHLRPARGPAHGPPEARHDLTGRRRPLGAARRHVRLRPGQAARPQHPVHGHRPPRAAGRRDRHVAQRRPGRPLRDHGDRPSPGPTSRSRGRCSTQRRASAPRSACTSTSRRTHRR